jgi:hypothetical protein
VTFSKENEPAEGSKIGTKRSQRISESGALGTLPLAPAATEGNDSSCPATRRRRTTSAASGKNDNVGQNADKAALPMGESSITLPPPAITAADELTATQSSSSSSSSSEPVVQPQQNIPVEAAATKKDEAPASAPETNSYVAGYRSFTATNFSTSLVTQNTAVNDRERVSVASTRGLSLHTKGADPAKCLDRIDDMYALYYVQEAQFSAKPYMDDQVDINRKMRSILVDWLVDVHNRFKLEPITLWLTVNILDRFLMKQQTMRSKLQLVGVSAMFIACKYEEIFPPFLRDCVCITDFAYAREDLLGMERDILVTLNYEIFVPTGYHFLSRYVNAINASESIRKLASYYAERNLQEYDSLNVDPHRMGATALFAALLQQEGTLGEHANYRTFWCKQLQVETGLSVDDLVPYARTMMKHVSEEPETASKRRLVACRKKYMAVSTLPLPHFTFFDQAL